MWLNITKIGLCIQQDNSKTAFRERNGKHIMYKLYNGSPQVFFCIRPEVKNPLESERLKKNFLHYPITTLLRQTDGVESKRFLNTWFHNQIVSFLPFCIAFYYKKSKDFRCDLHELSSEYVVR